MNYNETSGIISKQSLTLFMAFGIQKISMDTIASKCKISKKTIYKLFKDKNHLLSEILELKYSDFYNNLIPKASVQENAIEELDCFFDHVERELSASSYLFYYDLKKYHSNNYFELLKLKDHLITDFLLQNIDRGLKESLYKTVETEDLIKLYCFNIENLFVTSHSNENPHEKIMLLNTFNQLFKSNLVSLMGYNYITRKSRI